MRTRQILPIALLVGFGVACSDVAPGPTAAVPDERLLSHTPSHPGEPLYKLKLIPVEESGFATLATTCDPWDEYVIADDWNQSLRAGGESKVGVPEDYPKERFQLQFSPAPNSGSSNLFGNGPLCLGYVRDSNDPDEYWRDDLFLVYDRARGRHSAAVSLQWFFMHEAERYKLSTESSPTTLTWDQITSGDETHLHARYVLQDMTHGTPWPTVAEGTLKVKFQATPFGETGDPPPTPPGGEPQASFTYDCSNSSTCRFTDTSTGDPTEWRWSFGDGSTSTAQNPSHTYTEAYPYEVTLEVSNADGNDSAKQTITCRQQGPNLRCR